MDDIWSKAAEYSALATRLNSDPNIQFIIREEDLERVLKFPDLHVVEMPLKKAALYANRAIILTKPKTFFAAVGDPPETARAQWGGGEISRRLEQLYKNYSQNTAFGEAFYFMPERLNQTIENWSSEEDWYNDESNLFDFAATYNNKLGVEMSLSEPAINNHIFEALNCNGNELSVRNIWLPELKNVPFEALLKLREDEGDSFTRLQFALKQLIADTEELNSETKAKELFQRVDYEVRSFENKMSQIKKSRAVKTYEAILGFSVMGLCLAMPSEVAQIISSAIGIYSGKDFISALFREREQIFELNASDFYVPWLCTRKKAD